ncbi:MAG TPA: hypothetical protein IAC15_07865 [Candidatus Onthomonas avicola]|nr:hypothetical protein [Candidatus Onthomonas avicola]
MSVSGTFNYTTVDANAANGIMTLAISGTGDPTGGSEVISYDLRWTYDPATNDGGFTNDTWFAGRPGSPMKNYADDNNFNNYLMNQYSGGNEQNVISAVNDLLSQWSGDDRWTFTITLVAQLPTSCIIRG